MSAPYLGRIIRFKDFPELHQMLWEKGLTVRDRYGGRPYGATLSPVTERLARKGWGRLLATCPESGRLAAPNDLVIPNTIRRFIAAMKQAGNQGNTIATRLWEVRTALGIMCPEGDFRWITSPDGNDVRSLFPFERRPIRIYHPRLLYRWGCQLMDEAPRIANPQGRAVRYRSGLLIAVLAARAPRLRSLAGVRLGVQIVRHDDRFRFVFGKPDLKGKNALEYDLPADLTPHIEHYLRAERPVLLARQPAVLGKPDHGWLWVGQHGLRLRATGVEAMVRRESLKRFGAAFGPHRFRHAAGTLAPISDPKRPGAAAAMLGNSKAVLEKAYNLGQQQEAARRFQASLRQERQRLKGVALRAFGRAEKPPRRRPPLGSSPARGKGRAE